MVLTYQAVKKDNQIFLEPFFLESPVFEKFSEIKRGSDKDTRLFNEGNTKIPTF